MTGAGSFRRMLGSTRLRPFKRITKLGGISRLVGEHPAARHKFTPNESYRRVRPHAIVIPLAVVLIDLHVNDQTCFLDCFKRDVVTRKIVCQPGTEHMGDRQRGYGSRSVKTLTRKHVDLQSSRSKSGQGEVVTEELPAAEHVTEGVSGILQNLPSHWSLWCCLTDRA